MFNRNAIPARATAHKTPIGVTVIAAIAAGTALLGAGVASAGVPSTSGVCDGLSLNQMTSVTANPTGSGYWSFVDAQIPHGGNSIAAGGASNFGTVSDDAGIIRATPDGQGYYSVNETGVVHAEGDAVNFGTIKNYTHWDCGSEPDSNPISGLAVTPSGKGLWSVDAFGNVYTNGDAQYFGEPYKATNSTSDNAVAIEGTPDGQGYTVTMNDGGVYTYGDAHYFGHTGVTGKVTGMATTPDDGGYWILNSVGDVFAFGDAANYGNPPIISGKGNDIYTDISAMPGGVGYFVTTESGTVTAIGGTPIAHGGTDYDEPDTGSAIQLSASSENPIVSYAITSNPGNGSLTGFNATTGAITYTPNGDFEGNDSFTYTATDSAGRTSAPASVTIDVFDPCDSGNMCSAH